MSAVKSMEIVSISGREILNELQRLLPEIGFILENGNRKYNQDERLAAKITSLLKDLKLDVCEDIINLYTQLINLQQHLGHTVWRISKPITIQVTSGPGYLIPISVISGNPSLTPGGQQKAGWYIYIPVVADLSPELDCIFVWPKKHEVSAEQKS